MTASSTQWQVTIDRIDVTGVVGTVAPASALLPEIEAAVRAAIVDVKLPAGRSMRAVVQVDASALGSAGDIAQAVGGAVAKAVQGGALHG
jgi:hypothetical protein